MTMSIAPLAAKMVFLSSLLGS